jgi:hypothetical protein
MHAAILSRLISIEENRIDDQDPYHKDLIIYRSNKGFFALNEEDKIPAFEKLCTEYPVDKINIPLKVNTCNNGFVLKKIPDKDIYCMNLFVIQKDYFNKFNTHNMLFIKTSRELYSYISQDYGWDMKLQNINKDIKALNIIVTPSMFNKLNAYFNEADMMISRVIIFNTDEIQCLKYQEINCVFLWIENRFYMFNNTLTRKIFEDVVKVKGFLVLITADFYDIYYDETVGSHIHFSIPTKMISVSQLNDILYNITYITPERKENIIQKVKHYKEETCSICLNSFEKDITLGLTPCCYNNICHNCSVNMDINNNTTCFACKKFLCWYKDPLFVKLNTDKDIQINHLIDDYDSSQKYVILTSREYDFEDIPNVKVITNWRKLHAFKKEFLGADNIIFLDRFCETIKEKACYLTSNKNLNIYELA